MTDIRIGRILGIPIGVHWGALVLAVLLVLTLSTNVLPGFAPGSPLGLRIGVGIVGVLLLFASILAHELGHSVLALRHGIGIRDVSLQLLGGVARLESQATSARAEFQVAVAGPLTSVALAVFFAGLAVIVRAVSDQQLVFVAVAWLAGVNLLLAVFNLLPGAPLDGGRVLTAMLWRETGDPHHARITAGRFGLVLAVGVAAASLYLAFTRSELIWLFNVAVAVMMFTAALAEIRSAYLLARLQTPLSLLHLARPRPVHDHVTLTRFDELTPPGSGRLAIPVIGASSDQRPIGYVGPSAASIGLPERSWTRVGQVMHPITEVPRIGLHRTAGDLVDLWAEHPIAIAVTTDEHDRAVGTVTDDQLRPLVARPTWWGRPRAAGAAGGTPRSGATGYPPPPVGAPRLAGLAAPGHRPSRAEPGPPMLGPPVSGPGWYPAAPRFGSALPMVATGPPPPPPPAPRPPVKH